MLKNVNNTNTRESCAGQWTQGSLAAATRAWLLFVKTPERVKQGDSACYPLRLDCIKTVQLNCGQTTTLNSLGQ